MRKLTFQHKSRGWEGRIGIKHRHTTGCWAHMIIKDGWQQLLSNRRRPHGLHLHVGTVGEASIKKFTGARIIHISYLRETRKVPLAPSVSTHGFYSYTHTSYTHTHWFSLSVTYCAVILLTPTTVFFQAYPQCIQKICLVFAVMHKRMHPQKNHIFLECTKVCQYTVLSFNTKLFLLENDNALFSLISTWNTLICILKKIKKKV